MTGNGDRQRHDVVGDCERKILADQAARLPAHADGEWHRRQVAVQENEISGVAAEASYRWSKPRLWRTAVELQHAGLLDLIPLITHVAPFDDAPAMFARLDAGEPGLLQAMLDFGSAA